MGNKFRGGMPGMGNMGNMMKQMQKMQRQMQETQQRLEETEVTATSGGGAIEVVANGKKEIVSIKIDEDLLKDNDVDMLQDLILVAVNDAIKKVLDMSETELGKITGGINIPGF